MPTHRKYDQNNTKKFWMVWRAGWHFKSFVKHMSYDSAHAEAKRLSEKHRGNLFWVLEAIEFTGTPKIKKSKKISTENKSTQPEPDGPEPMTREQVKELSRGADLSARKGTVLLVKK